MTLGTDASERGLTRREFVKAAGVVAAGVAVAGSAAGCGLSGEPDEPVETPSYEFGKDAEVGKRILVAYATKNGSTVGVAEAIGKTLGERGFAVDVKPMKDGPALDGYDAVVLGSAINGGQWLPEALEYAKGKRAALGKLPVALFCVHAMNVGDSEGAKRKRTAYLDAVREVVTPRAEAYFAGVMHIEEQGFLAKAVWRGFNLGINGDARDWDKIRGWAKTMPLVEA